MTSHDVVGQLRKRFGERRIGHAERWTQMLRGCWSSELVTPPIVAVCSGFRRTYEVEIVFGTETDTLDASGQMVAEHDMSFDYQQIEAAAASLTGEIEQVPPMVSARRVGGRRLYEIAREGLEVDRESRSVVVSGFEVEATDDPLIWRALVTCSAGTYIRTLGADLGVALGGGAHIRNLRRTRSGHYSVEETGTIDEAPLLPVVELTRGMEPISLSQDEISLVHKQPETQS